MNAAVRLIGRSSSHFTRIARIFAAELGVEYAFDVVADLGSLDPAAYGGNPALKVPSLRVGEHAWFGALNVCRALAARAERELAIVWPEALSEPLLANAQELVLHGMASEVTLIMAKLTGEAAASPGIAKVRASLDNVLAWLDGNIEPALAALPARRELSYLEVSLFCFVTHLGFREIKATDGYLRLTAFCARFGERASARETSYKFDS